MPIKFNASRRDRFAKAKYRVTNWAEYNEALRLRAQTLLIVSDIRTVGGPITLVADSTGLRVHGGRDWMREKHGLPKARKAWRKLNIGLGPENGELVASRLESEHVEDPGALPDLLAEMAGLVHRFIADGAYDGTPSAATIRQTFGADVELIIPPPKNAVPGECAACNAHIDMIANEGRMAWQKATGCGQRSRGEVQIGRCKQVIGSKLRSRKLETQTTETKIAVKALNRMTHLGRALLRSFGGKKRTGCGSG
ncbi:transposase, partial [Ruegeria sp. HKCCSP335]